MNGLVRSKSSTVITKPRTANTKTRASSPTALRRIHSYSHPVNKMETINEIPETLNKKISRSLEEIVPRNREEAKRLIKSLENLSGEK